MVVYTRHAASLWLAFILAAVCASAQAKPEVIVAAAANLSQILKEIGPAFEAETGIHPVLSMASTAQLSQQIEYGAPFDVFLSADGVHVDQLVGRGLLHSASRVVYARGVLALWVPPGGKHVLARVEDLASPEIKVIAIAKPELAPYGAAAVTALRNARVWSRVQAKVVYAENINMAVQYGALGNADAVLTAYALVMNSGGTVTRVDLGLYPPIEQALGILTRAEHPAAAQKFVDYLLRGKGRDTLARAGYLVR